MLDLRKKIFIIIGVVLLLVLLFFAYWFFMGKQKKVIEEGNTTKNTSDVNTDSDFAKVIPLKSGSTDNTPKGVLSVDSSENNDEIYLKQLSKIFVERFGTYSNQNNNQHITDVYSLVTEEMNKWLETKKLANNSIQYEGVITKVVASHLENKDDTSATVIIQTQQTVESVGKTDVVQKSGKVVFSKVAGEWKVDGFFWD
ncbi:MAG: hypothetical protein WA057_00785 [Candidatus Magasanikiibacteriota bacterium]